MKTQATQQADTRKTTSLLKKYLKEQFGVTFRIRTEKYSMGSSINVSWTAGPDTKEVEVIVKKLQYGGYDSMTDCQLILDNEGLVIDGYKLEEFKHVFVEQNLPDNLFYDLAKTLSDNIKYNGVPELENAEQLDDHFSERFGSAWTWRDMLRQNFENRHFHTDDVENIKIVGIEDDPDSSWNTIFVYEYKGKTYKTKEVKPENDPEPEKEETEVTENNETEVNETKDSLTENGISTTNELGSEFYTTFSPEHRKNEIFYQYDYRHTNGELFSTVKKTLELCREARNKWIKKNNNQNENNMKKLEHNEIEEIQKVHVKYKSGKEIIGTVIKVTEKSFTVATTDGNKIVMFISEPEVFLIPEKDLKNENVENSKTETEKTTAKETAKIEIKTYFDFVKLIVDKELVVFPEKDMEKAQLIELTAKGKKALEKLNKDFEAGVYTNDIEGMVKKLSNIGKVMAKKQKVTKEKTNDETKNESGTKVNSKAKNEEKADEGTKKATEEHPIINMVASITDEKSFKKVLTEVQKQGIKFKGNKKGIEVELSEYKDGSVHVKNVESEQTYYCLPGRFAVHFSVK